MSWYPQNSNTYPPPQSPYGYPYQNPMQYEQPPSPFPPVSQQNYESVPFQGQFPSNYYPPQQNYAPSPQIYPPPQPFQIYPTPSPIYPPPSQNYVPPPQMYPQGSYQGTSPHQGSGQLTPITGNRKALLIGINYFDTPTARLNGPINDVTNMRGFLSRCSFQNMVVLTDDQTGRCKPTRQNIIDGFQWLLEGSRAGDSLFFHYSGHGSQVVDTDGDEADGYDETILPCDYKQTGQIVDDEIWDRLVRNVPPGCRLTAVMDCCHSGTGMDLPFIFTPPRSCEDIPTRDITLLAKNFFGSFGKKKKSNFNFGNLVENIMGNYLPSPSSSSSSSELTQEGYKVSVGDVILFSGCRDDQTAADTTAPSHGGKLSGGAMTTAFLDAANRGPGQSYAQLTMNMRNALAGRYSQVPQLSAGHMMDIHQPFAI